MGFADRDYYREPRPQDGAGAAPLSSAWVIPGLLAAAVTALAADRLTEQSGWVHERWALKLGQHGLPDHWLRWLSHPLAPPDLVDFGFAAVLAWICGRTLEARFGALRAALVSLVGMAAGAVAYLIVRGSGTPAAPLAGLLPAAFALAGHAARRLPREEVGVYMPLRIDMPLRLFAAGGVTLALLYGIQVPHSLGAVAALAGGAAGMVLPIPRRTPAPRKRSRPRRGERRQAATAPAADAVRMAGKELDAELDRLLAKIGSTGMASLTAAERRTLEAASRAKRAALGR